MDDGLLRTIRTAAHEFLHTFAKDTNIGNIPSEEGNIIEETLAEIIGWLVARDVVETYYPEHYEKYEEVFSVVFDEEGNYLNPRGNWVDSRDALRNLWTSRYGSSDLSAIVVTLINHYSIADNFTGIMELSSIDELYEQTESCLPQSPN